ncbi:MAG: hypothetical protein AAF616_12125 [Bacteroidota bacterium]
MASIAIKFYFIEDESEAIKALDLLNQRAGSGDPALDNMLLDQWKSGELNDYLYG